MAMLVVTPIREEFDCFARVFEQRWGSPEQRAVGRAQVHEYRAADVTLARGGLGKVQFAVTTGHLLAHLPEVNLVVCARCGRCLGGPGARRRRRGRHCHGGARLQSELRLTATLVRCFTAAPCRPPADGGRLAGALRRALRSGRQRRRDHRRRGSSGCASTPVPVRSRLPGRALEEHEPRPSRRSPTWKCEASPTWRTTPPWTCSRPTSPRRCRTLPSSLPGSRNNPFPRLRPAHLPLQPILAD